jgi:hypothetical protein
MAKTPVKAPLDPKPTKNESVLIEALMQIIGGLERKRDLNGRLEPYKPMPNDEVIAVARAALAKFGAS